MGCGSCGGGSCGTASGGCKTGGCNKLNVFDWLADMEESLEQRFLVVEVRFKAGRKEFFGRLPYRLCVLARRIGTLANEEERSQ